jgi:hypothetical protein
VARLHSRPTGEATEDDFSLADLLGEPYGKNLLRTPLQFHAVGATLWLLVFPASCG